MGGWGWRHRGRGLLLEAENRLKEWPQQPGMAQQIEARCSLCNGSGPAGENGAGVAGTEAGD